MNVQNTLKSAVLSITMGMLIAGPSMAAMDNLPESMSKPKDFPARPLTMVVPYGPGGGSGQFSGAIARAVKELTDVGINRDHKPGGSGMVGLSAYMSTPKDGYTIVEHIDDATSAYAFGSSKVNPAEDLIPLVIGQITFSQFYIRSDETRFTDWKSFVAYAKAHEGEVTLANVSKEGSMERINTERVLNHFGIKLRQVGFAKGGQRYGSLMGKQVDALFEQPGDVRGFLDSGDFKPILTLLKDRPSVFSQVPAMSDVGLDFEPLMRFRGIYVQKGIPEDRLNWLQWAFQKAFFQESYQKFNDEKFMNIINSYRNTEGAITLINDTASNYRKAFKELGIM